mgnify:CR=1 FL=1
MGLITAYEIKQNTSMGGNVDADKFIHLLNDVEALILEPSIGTALYDKIVTDYNEGGNNNLSGDYLELYNKYIKPVLWHSVFAQYLRDSIVLARNTGTFTNSPENASPSDLEDIQYTSKNAQSKADVYLERMERYLHDKNISEYKDKQPNDYDIDPREVNTIGGWFLGHDVHNNNCDKFCDFDCNCLESR